MTEALTPSIEDYLEAIKNLGKDKGVVRVKSIARELKVKMPSVSQALKSLAKEGLIKHEKYGYVELTAEGDKLAQGVCSRHQILFKFLNKVLGIDSKTADEDACKMEHVISAVTLKRLVRFLEFVESSPEGKFQGFGRN